jgi:hypothetical protein
MTYEDEVNEYLCKAMTELECLDSEKYAKHVIAIEHAITMWRECKRIRQTVDTAEMDLHYGK